MRRLMILAVALLAVTVAMAQEAIWGRQAVVSPEIHDDNTVTFRMRAPKAIKVEVTGDFFGVDAPRIAELKENQEGVWEYTTPEPLPSELYSYTFIVDGVRMNDPSNVMMIRDVASVASVFIVPGDPGDLYSVNDVPHAIQ